MREESFSEMATDKKIDGVNDVQWYILEQLESVYHGPCKKYIMRMDSYYTYAYKEMYNKLNLPFWSSAEECLYNCYNEYEEGLKRHPNEDSLIILKEVCKELIEYLGAVKEGNW